MIDLRPKVKVRRPKAVARQGFYGLELIQQTLDAPNPKIKFTGDFKSDFANNFNVLGIVGSDNEVYIALLSLPYKGSKKLTEKYTVRYKDLYEVLAQRAIEFILEYVHNIPEELSTISTETSHLFKVISKLDLANEDNTGENEVHVDVDGAN